MPMTTANKLTLLRILLIPVFLVLMYMTFPAHRLVALGVYILACLTDYLDGDHYFGISRRSHNLDRARTQFKLVADTERHWSEICDIITDCRP